MSARVLLISFATSLVAVACASEADHAQDGRDAVALASGKADGTSYSGCELQAVVDRLNTSSWDEAELKDGGVHTLAARNLATARNGNDGLAGTADDVHFASIDAVDAVPYVGPAALRQLVGLVGGACDEASGGSFEVIMSPQSIGTSHIARVLRELREAQKSIDIAMYSFSDSKIEDALGDAVDRGVRVRMVYEGASEDRKNPAGTTSARLEELGVDVRWVNKIMHHKFAIIDGVQAGEDPAHSMLITGSGNWSYAAATQFNENTLFVRGDARLTMLFQQEFNHMWNNSRALDWNAQINYVQSEPVDLRAVPSGLTDVAFTSDNFEVRQSSTYGPTFTIVRGRSAISDSLVAMIQSAQQSIHIASGHLRSRPVAEALIDAHQTNPALDIRVYLDGQEYISRWYHGQQLDELEQCLKSATTDNQTDDCYDKGFYFGYALHQEGIDVRYKYYAYRWDYTYAPQMHHKYIIVDDRKLATGSYNLSDNAEHNTFENMVFIDGATQAALVDRYAQDFDSIWATDDSRDRYHTLLNDVQNGVGDFPIVFEPMALDWSEVTRLKGAIRDACPTINSDAFRENPAAHQICSR